MSSGDVIALIPVRKPSAIRLKLHSEFEAAIEDFLLDCKKQGIRSEKPASGKLMLRVPPEVHGAALVAAKAAGKA